MNKNKKMNEKRKVIFVELQKLNVNEDLILKLIDQGKFDYLSNRYYLLTFSNSLIYDCCHGNSLK